MIFLDFETTFQIINNNKDPSPYLSENKLVSVGWAIDNSDILYDFFYHKDLTTYNLELKEIIEREIRETDLLVAFNAKFELSWLKAIGIDYTGKIADPMIREYVLAKGQKLSVSLEESCKRNNVALKKSELVQEYLKKNIGFDEIPVETVKEYGIGDIESLRALYYNQIERLNAQPWLWPTVNLMEEFCRCLTDIEFNGLKIDIKELDKLEIEYKKEFKELEDKLNLTVKEVMGDIPINLDSPEQLSWVLYSRKVKDKKKWKEIFNLGTELRGSVVKPKYKSKMSTKEFVDHVRENTEIIYKTTASQCMDCQGKGLVKKVKKDQSLFKKSSICRSCSGNGYVQNISKTIAGFKFVPKEPSDVSAGGFSVSLNSLKELAKDAKERQREFLEGLQRSSAIRTYLGTFIDGIRRGIRNNSIIHPGFMQCVTATGRLSSRNPNFQNLPRGNTFPIKKCIVSRFDGGCILSGDAKQLEFRIAGELSNDKQILQDVLDKIDVHSQTSKHTGYNRQDSKPYTFAPVYGATDRGKDERIARYFRYFQDRYKRLFQAHIEWQDRVLVNDGLFRLPSGREYYYPNTFRRKTGGVSNSTIIANYPVQGFATADLMVIFCLNTWILYKEHNLKSLVILEVHDDVTCDVYPGELEIAAKLMVQAFNSLPEECIKRYNYTLKMPLEIELKVGPNGLEQTPHEVR